MDNRIGITTTVPIEAVFAADLVPVDLNNIFIASDDPNQLIEDAECAGFPRAYCAWVKGIYGAIKSSGINRIVGVTRGDCSDTHALCEILISEGIGVVPFAYPENPDAVDMEKEINKLCSALGTELSSAEKKKEELDAVREKLIQIDKIAYEENKINGSELFDLQINSSDFQGNVDRYSSKCDSFLEEIKNRSAIKSQLRLGLAGIPPIYSNLLGVLEEREVNIVYHQIPRQFTIPAIGKNLAESYTEYTYPYSFAYQLEDIINEVKERKLDGIIHYVQSFCHRQLYDRMLKEKTDIPVLSIEGDRPSEVDGRILTRIEAFIETIS
ncbi:MAG: 2-hydroxyacyl-CoA dehydratase [Planctomycetota bacterium]|jgi:benzoyl-CoA reductase/2-hydroxyglutaryl-CoA dehydratase subunit BcrC/BadD/HgdB